MYLGGGKIRCAFFFGREVMRGGRVIERETEVFNGNGVFLTGSTQVNVPRRQKMGLMLIIHKIGWIRQFNIHISKKKSSLHNIVKGGKFNTFINDYPYF